MRVEHDFADGDALMHALIATGGHDPEFLTADQLAAAPLRLPVADYLDWYATLPADLREAIEEQLGAGARRPLRRRRRPRGRRPGARRTSSSRSSRRAATARIRSASTTTPSCRPTHHYLACYRWIQARWGADAIVHLGKHGTLEWTPGKMLALSESCAPDAALGSLPLVYPFVVNDPGEGVQAKRRAHATIVDHLVPPMMRADTYDEMAELEALLDEYARLEVLDPSKLPGLAARIWSAIERANLQADLDIHERPDDVGKLVEHIDGYLCEVKDIQVKDGLHVLGRAPRGRSAARARRRPCCGSARATCRACAAPSARRSGSTSRRWWRRAARRSQRAPARPRGALPRPERQRGRPRRPPRGRAHGAARRARRARLDGGRGGGGVRGGPRAAPTPASSARCASPCDEVVPRILRDARRADQRRARPARPPHRLRALGRADPGAHRRAADRAQLLQRRPARPARRSCRGRSASGSPTRCSTATGRETGALPRMVGLVAWGTAAMRTQGDDVAEILALLGVRPTWHPESQARDGHRGRARSPSSAGRAST